MGNNAKAFEAKMREGEWFHNLTVPKGLWAVLRMDGRSFSKFTQSENLKKPFDIAFCDTMVAVTRELLIEFNGLYGYTESDEISLLLPLDWDLFDREVEKVVSLSAAKASVAFSMLWQKSVTFDSRIWIGTSEAVLDYFSWRQADASRNALNGYAYWTLRDEGNSARKATSALTGLSTSDKNELLFGRGINYNDVPTWQKRGVGVYWTYKPHLGFNPITQQEVPTTRRTAYADYELPMGENYRNYISEVMSAGV